MISNVIIINDLKYKAIKPTDSFCTSCDLRDHECWKLDLSTSCLASDREDGKYVNYKLIKGK